MTAAKICAGGDVDDRASLFATPEIRRVELEGEDLAVVVYGRDHSSDQRQRFKKVDRTWKIDEFVSLLVFPSLTRDGGSGIRVPLPDGS